VTRVNVKDSLRDWGWPGLFVQKALGLGFIPVIRCPASPDRSCTPAFRKHREPSVPTGLGVGTVPCQVTHSGWVLTALTGLALLTPNPLWYLGLSENICFSLFLMTDAINCCQKGRKHGERGMGALSLSHNPKFADTFSSLGCWVLPVFPY
jgi:hypothetical protein